MNTTAHSRSGRVDIELERERHERQLHDDERAGLAASEELRSKDARENAAAFNLKRSNSH